MNKIYISTARLKDNPQVRIQSDVNSPWVSLDACIDWCKQHCFSFIIKETVNSVRSVQDKTLYEEH